MDEIKLKPCPFCGERAVFKTNSNFSSHHKIGFNFEIECEDCGAKLPKLYKVEFSLTDDGGIKPLFDDRKRLLRNGITEYDN